MNTDNRRERAAQFTKELKKVQTLGHIYKTSSINDNDATFKRDAGVELFIDAKVSDAQIRKIVHYIVSHYNFDAYYYTKSHSIKVWYRNAK